MPASRACPLYRTRGWILTSIRAKVSLEEIFHDLTRKATDIHSDDEDMPEDEHTDPESTDKDAA